MLTPPSVLLRSVIAPVRQRPAAAFPRGDVPMSETAPRPALSIPRPSTPPSSGPRPAVVGETISHNPATLEEVGRVPNTDLETMPEIFRRARAAQAVWAKNPIAGGRGRSHDSLVSFFPPPGTVGGRVTRERVMTDRKSVV